MSEMRFEQQAVRLVVFTRHQAVKIVACKLLRRRGDRAFRRNIVSAFFKEIDLLEERKRRAHETLRVVPTFVRGRYAEHVAAEVKEHDVRVIFVEHRRARERKFMIFDMYDLIKHAKIFSR